MKLEERIRQKLRYVEDFPREGISFVDITPLLLDSELCDEISGVLAEPFRNKKIDAIAGIEARGFLFGMLMAQNLNTKFIPLRKRGKLPGEVLTQSYDLEYGSAEIEVHKEDLKAGQNILIHDDLLATGGTATAAVQLIKKAGCDIAGFSFLIELSFLKGRALLQTQSAAPFHALLSD